MEYSPERRHVQRRQLVDRRAKFRWGAEPKGRRQALGRRSGDQFVRFIS